MIFPRIFIKCHMQTNKYLCNHLSTFRKTLMAKSTCCAWNNTKHMPYLYRHFFFIRNILVKLLGNLLVMNCNYPPEEKIASSRPLMNFLLFGILFYGLSKLCQHIAIIVSSLNSQTKLMKIGKNFKVWTF